MTYNINTLIIPTGIGAQIGGFAGDGNPVAKLLSKVSDILITHPNVINGACLTDIPKNVYAVSGYLLDRFFAGQVALRLNQKHRLGVIVDSSASEQNIEIIKNVIGASITMYGLDVHPKIFFTKKPLYCTLSKFNNHDILLDACVEAKTAGATALAVLCQLPDPPETVESQAYEAGKGVDPIGLMEAKISNTIARQLLMPVAHAPIIDPPFEHTGIVHPRVAAEHIGLSYLPSVMKCLQKSPLIIPLEHAYKVLTSDYTDPRDIKLKRSQEDITVQDVAHLVTPYDCCNGVPMIEAGNHDIELLTVLNNTTVLEEPAEYFALKHKIVNNYLEAAGYILANSRNDNFINPSVFYTDEI